MTSLHDDLVCGGLKAPEPETTAHTGICALCAWLLVVIVLCALASGCADRRFQGQIPTVKLSVTPATGGRS